MNEDLSELVKYLDEKFSKIDGEFKEIDGRFDRLFQVFATREDLERAIENISTKEDFDKFEIFALEKTERGRSVRNDIEKERLERKPKDIKKLKENVLRFFKKNEITDDDDSLVIDMDEVGINLKTVIMDNMRIKMLTTPEAFELSNFAKDWNKKKTPINLDDDELRMVLRMCPEWKNYAPKNYKN